MKILSITAQKADSTGSGVFLTELVNGFHKAGCQQAVICGTVAGEKINLPENVSVFPVFYKTDALPFPVCGMSDEMPYESTRYRDLDANMTQQLFHAFSKRVKEAISAFDPDVILCHHLYFLAALVRQIAPDIPVYGQCHGSDLRQIRSNSWQRDWIKEQIPKLDGIFALHAEQKESICQTFSVSADHVHVMGTGYNSHVFFRNPLVTKKADDTTRLIFAGKLSEKKGLFSLIHAMDHLSSPECTELLLAGGSGNQSELDALHALAEKAPCPVRFLGKLDQKSLAHAMNESDIFVLPSFYEGLPLVLIEAMACGLRTVCTDLPGIRPWLDSRLPDHGTVFVDPPSFYNVDEPIAETLPAFEHRLAKAIETAARRQIPEEEIIRTLSWDSLCQQFLDFWIRSK